MLYFFNWNTKVLLALLLKALFSVAILSAQRSERLSYFQEEQKEKANNYFESGDYYSAINLYSKINKKSPQDTLVIFRLAESYKMLNSFKQSEKWYSSILQEGEKINSSYSMQMLNFAQLLTINGKYDEALYWYQEYYFSNSADPRGKAGINTIENLNKLYHDTVFYVAYPSEINTSYSEFCPTYYDNGIVFISDRPKAKVSGSNKGSRISYLSWYYSAIDETGKLGNPVKFNKKKDIKTTFNEGPVVFYNNGNSLIFTQNTLGDNKTKEEVNVHQVQLYLVEKNSQGRWGEASRMSFCDEEYSYAQPAISSDGKSLVFSSTKPGGFGGSDLYLSERVNGMWSEPINLGERINSKGDEMFPYILNDSVLFFSSDGHGGLGGLDICRISMIDSAEVVKFGYPVNSSGDDFGIMYDEDGISGYFSSNRESLNKKDNIFIFKIVRVSLSLKIIDINTSNPINDAEVFSITGVDEKFIGKTDLDGFCNVIIPVSKEIKIRIKKEDFISQIYSFEPVKYKAESAVVLPVNTAINLSEKSVGKKDVTYKVQVMACRKKASNKQVKRKYKGDLQVVMSFEDNWYKYTVGEFKTFNEACECLQGIDIYDAFIAAYIENKRVALVLTKSESRDKDCRTEKRDKLSDDN